VTVHSWLRVLAAVGGGTLLLATVASMLRTLVVPRAMNSLLTRCLSGGLRGLLRLLSPAWRGYPARDRAMAWHAPLMLAGMLLSWMLGMLCAYGLLTFAVSGLPLRVAFREAGSSLFTLGFAATDRLHLSLVDFAAAATGPLVTALLIAYLPTLYAAYNRREVEVTLLQVRAGEPAWGPELLARQGLVDTVTELRVVYQGWERLAADIGESHANYPILLAFRSPRPYRSWIVSLLAVLDGAALHLALAPASAPREARLALRAGFTALRDIAVATGLPYDPDPLPDGPVQLMFAQFEAAVDRVRRSGFAVERTAAEAWPHFRGWRVNYEHLAYEVARSVDAVPALWSGPRDFTTEAIAPIRPVDRRPAETGSVAAGAVDDDVDDPFTGQAAAGRIR
jgi:hypothetical protein